MNSAETQPKSPRGPLRIPLAALHAVEATSVYFAEQSSAHEAQLPEVEIADHERTAEGFIELGWKHLETQKSLHIDLQHDCSGPLTEWPRFMQERAREAVEKFNQDRKEPVDIHKVNTTFLFRLAEPRWTDEISDEHIEQWPEEYQADLEMLREIDDKLQVLSADEALRQEAREVWSERTDIMRQAAAITGRERKLEAIVNQIAGIRARAAETGQALSRGKERQIQRLEASMAALQKTLYNNTIPLEEERAGDPNLAEVRKRNDEKLRPLQDEIERRMRKELRRQFEAGLVLTDDMRHIIRVALPSLVAGNPALLVGETGGAKTALAKYLSRECIGKEPEIVSGYADVNGYQLMGKTGLVRSGKDTSDEEIRRIIAEEGLDWDKLSPEQRIEYRIKGKSLDTASGATISDFIAGPVVRAVEEGRPLILDEINAMPPEFLKRLNIIAQLRPGMTFSVQEDSGRVITVKQGFCIIATANEKSRRYSGVHDLSTEFRNRFTANTYHIGYPDADVVVGQEPLDNYKVAYGAVSDRAGEVLFGEGVEKLEAFAKAAHMTQRLFSGHIREGLSDVERDVIGSARLADAGATGLDENVIAPRTMVDLLEKVVQSRGAVMLAEVLKEWTGSIKSPHDKQVITTILSTRGLLGARQPEPQIKDAA